jgi:molybdopterin synthase sulfur carrier subunit
MADGSSDVQVLIPTPLRRFTGGAARVSVSGATVGDVLDALEAAHPGIGAQVRDDGGEIRRFVNVFVNGVNVRDADGAATAVKRGDEVGIIPAMAGGGA